MTLNNLYNKLENIRKDRGAVAVALIDPDKKHSKKIPKMVELINNADFDVIFVGGSSMEDEKFKTRLKRIKSNTDLPVIIFPGDSNQISKDADAILYLSLLSGRNPDFLIGEQVKSAPLINKHSIEVIPTGYILIDGNTNSSVQKVSNTKPLPMDNLKTILHHALAAEYLGKSFVFLEAGSGAKNHVTAELIEFISPNIKIPIIVGGGITSPTSAKNLTSSGASYLVIGSKIEALPTQNELLDITNAIHGNN